MKNYLYLVTLTSALLAGGSATADTAFSNLGSGANLYQNPAYPIEPGYTEGFQFTPSFTGTLESFTLGENTLFTDGTTQGFQLDLYQDSSDGQLGSHIGTWYGTSSASFYYYTNSALVTVDASASDLTLTGGQDYWLVDSGSQYSAWNTSYASPTTRYFDGSYYYPGQAGAFSVQMQPAATPEACSLLGLIVPVVGFWWRNRRQAR